jgi:hypothetical protein
LIGADEFADLTIHVLGTGIDIIHAGAGRSYSVLERLRGIFRSKPTFLHAWSGKPWLWLGGAPYWSQGNLFSACWHRRLLQELSPYVCESRRYRHDLRMNSSWMDRRTGIGMLLRAVGCGHFALRGLPLTVAAAGLKSLQEISRKVSTPSGEAPSVCGT